MRILRSILAPLATRLAPLAAPDYHAQTGLVAVEVQATPAAGLPAPEAIKKMPYRPTPVTLPTPGGTPR